jgi:hypothetical protein
MCSYWIYDCRGCSVDEDLNPLRQTMVQQANVAEFNKLNLDVTDLLMSDKEESCDED